MSVCGDATPLLTFGVVTDVQYADCDNRPAGYDPAMTRFYRNALDHVEHAFQYWKKFPSPVSFALQLGDIIDGLNSTFGTSLSSLDQTLAKFESHCSIPTFHTVGNHELYNFSRVELSRLFHCSLAKMNIPLEVFTPLDRKNCDNPILYYKFCPNKHVKFISLDCFDISVLGYDTNHPHYQEAAVILEYYHKHSVFEDWDCSGKLEGLDIRFQQMNGAVGLEQLSWLEEELADSDRKGQKVIVFGHVCLSPESADWSCLLWNYEDIISCFHNHHCVIAYLSGHSHMKGYSVDSHGIHYIVFTGIVETPPDTVAFATISVFPDKLEIIGHGREESYSLTLPSVRFPTLNNNVVESDAVLQTQNISVSVKV